MIIIVILILIIVIVIATTYIVPRDKSISSKQCWTPCSWLSWKEAAWGNRGIE